MIKYDLMQRIQAAMHSEDGYNYETNLVGSKINLTLRKIDGKVELLLNDKLIVVFTTPMGDLSSSLLKNVTWWLHYKRAVAAYTNNPNDDYQVRVYVF